MTTDKKNKTFSYNMQIQKPKNKQFGGIFPDVQMAKFTVVTGYDSTKSQERTWTNQKLELTGIDCIVFAQLLS